MNNTNLIIADMRKLHVGEDYDVILNGWDKNTRASVTRFKQEKGRHCALVRTVLLRYVLKEKFGTPEVELVTNACGKPYVKIKEKEEFFDFNISHSGDLVAICWGNVPMGVDVERIDRIKDYKKLLRYYYEPERERVLASCDPEQEFIRIWTFREAFSKEEGVGITLFEKDVVSIDYENNAVCFHGVNYCFAEYDYPGYKITLCTEKGIVFPKLIWIDQTAWKKMI